MTKNAREMAKEYGIDYEQLLWFRTLTPTERLYHLEAMVELTLAAQAAREAQKRKVRDERTNQLRRSAQSIS